MDGMILHELNIMKNSNQKVTMFASAYKTSVIVYADIYCVMNDQPERRKNLGVALGNSSFHKRMGYIMDYKQLLPVIPSCKACSKSIQQEYNGIIGKSQNKNNKWRKSGCRKCSAWLYHMDSKLLYYKPDANYPTNMIPKSGKIGPKLITRNYLENGVKLVHDGIILKQFKRNDAANILRYFGFNGEAIDNIIGNAYNAAKWEEANQLKNHNPILYQNLRSDYEGNKNKYRKWKLPKSWFGEDHIQLYVDVPMHLLFLGITKSVMSKTSKWLTSNDNLRLFSR
jgi:hypothetical protein